MDQRSTTHDYEMITIAEWMPELHQQGRDCRWVERNLDLLAEAITHGLCYEHYAQKAIEALNIIFPCVIERDDYRRWEPLLYDALNHAHNLRDTEYQAQVWAQLGQNYLKFGMRRAAATAFISATGHADAAQSPEMMLRGRIGMLRTQALYRRTDFNHVVHEIRALCRQIHDQDLHAQAYYALALAYLFRSETRQALGYGQMAYAIWHQLKNGAQKANVAFTLAEVCRLEGCFALSERFSNLGKTHLAGTDYAHKSAVFAYQTGARYLMEKSEYDAAEEWLQIALNKLDGMAYPYLIGAAHHALGIAQTERGKFSEALCNLKAAFSTWCRLDNWHEQASVCHAMGYLAFRQGKRNQAARLYRRARLLALDLPESAARQKLLDEIDDDVRKLPLRE